MVIQRLRLSLLARPPAKTRTCKVYHLLAELNFIQPKLIIFLGRHALSNFFPEAKISEVHGKLLVKAIPNFPTKYFFALYHPAAAMYNGALRETLLEDFQKIPLALEKIKD